ncbi:MAG TPA: ABC transporter ATP-binding protein [Syntrophomonadaceae bacterium]|nr:ABC transporter ATP-binding protein [Syntrophomonadaceae bacterium]
MILSVKNMAFSYPSREVLNSVSFAITEGKCIGVLGTNGTGKSTLLKCIDRILKPQGGTVYVGGEDIHNMSDRVLAQKIGYVAQNQQQTRCTVFDSVLLGRKPYIKWDVSDQDIEIVEHILHTFDLSEYAMRYTDELSGGELQKVVIARALAQQPKVLLLDEPTSNLDLKNQLDVIDTIKEIVEKQKLSAVVTMHDLNLALRFADKFLLLKGGEVYAAGGSEIINPENIKEVYDVDVVIQDCYGTPVVVPLKPEKMAAASC